MVMDSKQVHVTRILSLEPVAHAEQLCAPAGIADSVLGFAAWMFGVPSVTARIHFQAFAYRTVQSHSSARKVGNIVHKYLDI
jgi:hypothetical protein